MFKVDKERDSRIVWESLFYLALLLEVEEIYPYRSYSKILTLVHLFEQGFLFLKTSYLHCIGL